MILLTFLGLGRYVDIIYRYKDKELTSKYIQEALINFFNIDRVIIYATPEVKEHDNLKNFLRILNEKKINYDIIEIPNVEKEDDLWVLFKKIFESVPENEEIILDITHSFRSLPFLGFLILLFLKEVKNIKINGVYYGAFEMSKKLGYALIIDLSKAIDLANWVYATKNLKKYGKADDFNELVGK